MLLKHFFIEKIAHSSYLLAGNNSCAVIDPARDAGMYQAAAEEAGLKITHILETHLHADFLSGHIDLAEATGAEIVAPASANCSFPHMAVASGDSFMLEDMKIDVMETPGHTPEHVSYVVTDLSRGEDPVGVFCGDTLFVGDAGRPDLFPGRAKELAGKLFSSLQQIMKLPDFCEVWPAHGAGSLCGRAVGAKYRSTIGYERKFNEVLQIKDRDEFIEDLTTGMPLAPDHFSRCSEMNRQGPVLLRKKLKPESMTPEDFHNYGVQPGVTIVDVRSCDSFSAQHIPGAVNISMLGNFPTFAGWILEPGTELLIVADSTEQALEAVRSARMVCENEIRGFLTGGLFSWATKGLPAAGFKQIFTGDLKRMISRQDITLVDVRGKTEYSRGTIGNAVNIPAPELRTRFGELEMEKEIVLFCSSGHRSSLAASILQQKEFTNLTHLSGGFAGWKASL